MKVEKGDLLLCPATDHRGPRIGKVKKAPVHYTPFTPVLVGFIDYPQERGGWFHGGGGQWVLPIKKIEIVEQEGILE